MNLKELTEKRDELYKSTMNFLREKQGEDGHLSKEDDEKYEKMETELLTVYNDIKNYKETTPVLVSKPINNVEVNMKNEDYKNAMLDALRSKFRVISDVLREGSAPDGGYLVPEEYDSRLIDVLDEENIMRTLATKITTSGEHKINIAGTKPAASWVEEGEELSFGDAKFDQKILDAHKLHVAVKVTEELLYDNAYDLEGYLITSFGKALANAEEDAFINGDGNGRPTGFLHETKGGTFALSTASATDIKADEIINLVYSLKRPYRKNAKFIMNDQTISYLRKLKDNNGQYLWQPSLTVGEPDRLLGYEVYTSSYFPKLEAGKPVIAFGDFSYYNIGDRGTRTFDELRELFAGNGMIAFLAKERVDGILVLPEAVQILSMKASG